MCNIQETASFHCKSKVHFSFSQFYIAEISLQQFREYFPFLQSRITFEEGSLVQTT
jgi:hypothetical protein